MSVAAAGRSVLEPFAVHVADDVLDDLRGRLERTRFADDLGDGWQLGVDPTYLRELVDYWLSEYDWRREEERINRLTHHRVVLDGVPIHFVHEPGRGPSPMPLVLTHGWPWTFWDMRRIVGRLADPASHGGDPADAFDVVVPSLPGFAFSSPLTARGVNFWTTADLWDRLMREVLGYERFAAHGDDWGGLVTSQLGHKYADHLAGIHVTMVGSLGMWNRERPWDVFGPVPPELPDDVREELLAVQRKYAYHTAVHVLAPQTLAAAMEDSPAGMCAWILAQRRAWSDCGGDVEARFGKDDLVTAAMLFWVTRTFPTSIRYYAEAVANPWSPSHDGSPPVNVPTGISLFLPDLPVPPPASHLEQRYRVTLLRHHSSGGHFAPFEEPDTVVQDIRDTFRPLR